MIFQAAFDYLRRSYFAVVFLFIYRTALIKGHTIADGEAAGMPPLKIKFHYGIKEVLKIERFPKCAISMIMLPHYDIFDSATPCHTTIEGGKSR